MGNPLRATRIVFAGCVFLGDAIVAACSGGGGGTVTPPLGTPSPTPSATAAPSPTPTAVTSPTPSPTPSATGSASAGGTVNIPVPTPAPVVCSPSPVSVAVAQATVVECTAQGYDGPLRWSVGDSTIASVAQATGTYTFFYIHGLKAGTTALSLSYPPSGAGSVSITVTQ